MVETQHEPPPIVKSEFVCCQGVRGGGETQTEPPPSVFIQYFFRFQGERGVVETHAEPPPSIKFLCLFFNIPVAN